MLDSSDALTPEPAVGWPLVSSAGHACAHPWIFTQLSSRAAVTGELVQREARRGRQDRAKARVAQHDLGGATGVCGRHAGLRARDRRAARRRWPGGRPGGCTFASWRFLAMSRGWDSGSVLILDQQRRRHAAQPSRDLRHKLRAACDFTRSPPSNWFASVRQPGYACSGRISRPIPLGGRVIRARPLFWVRLRGLSSSRSAACDCSQAMPASRARNSSQFAASPARSLQIAPPTVRPRSQQPTRRCCLTRRRSCRRRAFQRSRTCV